MNLPHHHLLMLWLPKSLDTEPDPDGDAVAGAGGAQLPPCRASFLVGVQDDPFSVSESMLPFLSLQSL